VIANIGRQRERDMKDKKAEVEAGAGGKGGFESLENANQASPAPKYPTLREERKARFKEEKERLRNLALAADGLIHLPKDTASKEKKSLWQRIQFLCLALGACVLLYFSYTDPARLAAQLALGAAAGWIFSSTNRQIERALYFGRQAPLLLRIIAFPVALTLLGLLLFHFHIESTSALLVGMALGHMMLQQKHPVRAHSEVINAPNGGVYQMGLILLFSLLGFVSAAALHLSQPYVGSLYALLTLYLLANTWIDWRWFVAHSLAVICFVLAFGLVTEI